MGGYGLVSRDGGIKIMQHQLFASPIRAGKHFSSGAYDLTPPRKRERLISVSFHSGTVTGDRENTVLQAAGDHGVLTIGEDQVRGVADDICTSQHQCARRLGE